MARYHVAIIPAATYQIYADLFASQDNAGACYAPAVVWTLSSPLLPVIPG